MTQEINIFAGKRNLKTEYKHIPLKELHYYPANPRISSILINFKGKLNDEIIHKLMDEKQPEATRSLFQQIKKDGIINEPLIVYGGQVIEGNTRLWVARELFKRAKNNDEKKLWGFLPCRVIKGKVSEEEINYILCNVHIKHKKDWLPFEQACYIYRMSLEGMKSQKIKEISTFSIKMINDYIEVYKQMEKHHTEPGDFNRYYEAYKDKEVKDFHNLGKADIFAVIKNKTKEGKMGVARDSRKLKKILTSKRAIKMFFKEGADVHRAFDVAILENPEEGDPLLKRVRELEEDLKHIQFDKLEEIKKDKTKMEVIKSLFQQIKNLCKELNITF